MREASMKKIISVLLSFSILLSVLSISFNALASEGSSSISVQRLNSAMPSFNSTIGTSSKKTYNGKTYYGDGKELYEPVRQCIDSRSSSVKIRYYSKEGVTSAVGIANTLVDIIKHSWSDEMSVTSTDGDYAHWGINDLGFDYTKHSANYYDFTLKFGYYNTDAQEKAVDTAINSIVTDIRKKSWSDYKTIKYIHDYICNSTTYCYPAVNKPEKYPTAFTAYGALVSGKCVCQGYAVAFYRICRELGYKVRFVYSGQGNHAWNIIKLDDKTYFVDCTWDDSIMDASDDETTYEVIDNNPYYYFLADYDTMRSLDGVVFYSQAHLVDRKMMLDDDFDRNYMSILSDEKYDYANAGYKLSACSVSTEYSSATYSSKAKMPSITVKTKSDKVLTKDKDYRVSYSSNVSCGRGLVKITGLGKYSGQATTRTFVITPSKMDRPSVASGGRSNRSLKIKWTKPSSSPTGYVVEMEKNHTWARVATVDGSKSSCTITSLTPNSKQRIRIRAYKKIGRYDYYGSPSSTLTTYTTPNTPSLKTLESRKGAVSIGWSKVGCTGYEVQYCTDKSMKGAKTVTLSSNSKNLQSLKKGKRYYVRVRAYRRVSVSGSTKIYRSSWCTKKSVTVK